MEEAIKEVLRCLGEVGHTELYLIDARRTYNRLLRLAEQTGEVYFTEKLAALFLEDNKNATTGDYRHERFLAHNRCIRFLRSYLETGQAVLGEYQVAPVHPISERLLESLKAYDQSEQARGLSNNTLAKNRRPVRYFLEYMTTLKYQKLSDIRPGDTLAAIEDMLDRHYAPTSLATALSGMRRFFEMFPELHPFRMEIPSKMPRKRSIIDVYSDEEQERISAYLRSTKISKRDAAIGFLAFETGLRGVDICNLRLCDVDWKHNSIHIVQSKTRKPLNLPLRTSYGNAMVEYLLNERPSSDLDYFFLSAHAPYVKLKTTWDIISAIVKRAGLETDDRPTGTRMFRHNAASTMLRKGIPLSVIAEELGHRSPDSTMVYLSTDQETLSTLTLPLPKGGCVQ